MELAKAFGTHYILNSKYIEKSFRKAAFKAEKRILVYEGGESMRLDDYAIEEGVQGTKRLLASLEMIDYNSTPQETIFLKESNWVRARSSGIFNASVKLGDSIKKGQVLARISDPYGQIKEPIKSPTNGYVLGLNNLPVINVGMH